MTTATATRTPTATNWPRIAGLGGIVFAALVAVTNLIVPNPPAWDTPGGEVATWVHQHHTALAITVAPFPIAALGLFVFGAGLLRRVRQSDDADASQLALVGFLGIIFIAAMFGMVEVARLVLLSFDGSASATPGLVELAWHLEGAAFAINMGAVSIALFGVAGAAVRVGLAPSWFRPLSIVGVLLGLAAAVQAPGVVQGASGWQIGLVAFVSWLLLLVVVGTRMLRDA